jgi:hypothetical protein
LRGVGGVEGVEGVEARDVRERERERETRREGAYLHSRRGKHVETRRRA